MKKKELIKNQKGVTTLVLIIILFVAVVVIGVVAYLFLFKPGMGILVKEEETSESNLTKPQIDIEIPDSSERAVDMVVTVRAYTDDKEGIKGIKLPDGTTIDVEEYEYLISKNGEYKFVAIGKNGEETSKTININNIVEASATEPYIPEGFEHVTGTVDEGFVIKDKYDNEYVWVPVPKGRVIRNTDFSTDYQEQSTELTNSVAKYYGFYIARYEASKSAGSRVASIPYADPWTNISYTKAAELSDKMTEEYRYDEYTKTSIMNSYAWDTTLAWIDETVENYSSETRYGNYSGEIAKTGETSNDIVRNIADLAGNVREWTTEIYTKAPTATPAPNSNSAPSTSEVALKQRVIRGGSASVSKTPAGHSAYYENQSDEYWGFRVILYRVVTNETPKKKNNKATPTPAQTSTPNPTEETTETSSTDSDNSSSSGVLDMSNNINQSATNAVEDAISTMAKQEIKIFNQKFEPYSGDSVKGTSVKSLITTVVTNNSTDEDKLVKVNGISEATKIAELRNKVSNSSQYKVEVEYDDNGLVNSIKISGDGI